MQSRKARTSSRSNWPNRVSHMLYGRQQQAESRRQERIMATTQPSPATSPIGRDTPRIDGPRQVTGLAQYTSEFNFSGMLYAVPVEATIANGKLLTLDTSAAEKMSGVRAVFHRGNIGRISRSTPAPGFDRVCLERRPPFEDDVIRYYGQYIALAVADTFEAAKAAADAVRVTYEKETPNVEAHLEAANDPPVILSTYGPVERVQSKRGDAEGAFASAPVKLDETYVTPVETHNPLELHATTAMWDGDSLTLYDSTQGVVNARSVLAQMFGLAKENVRVISKFLGSGFGGKLYPWTHVRLAATSDGKLVSFMHDYVYHMSMRDDYHEDCGEATPFHYSVPNLRVSFGRARRNIGATADMRGPGAVPGLFATESAMNEMAERLKMDPVQFRILNEPKLDEALKIPFSSRHYVECLNLGAEKFGWSKRDPAVGAMKRDGLTLGWGMSGAAWIAGAFAAEANLQLRDDGTVRVACATQDIGTGTYTILAQLASQKTGVPLDKIDVELGDSALPDGPISGGSLATSSVIPAVFGAADQAITSLLLIAVTTPRSPFLWHKPGDLALEGGRVFVKAEGPAQGIPFGDVLRGANARLVTGSGRGEQTTFIPNPKVSMHSFGCHFAEVTWQPETARLRVSRVVTVMDAGRILNPLTGRNQIQGGVVMGIGMALFEETTYDPQNGAPINSNLADYVMTVNADAPPIEVHFLDFPDKEINELGARGIGEIGLAGIAAAITDAVHHATGVRVRELPVKIENLLA